MMDSSLDRSFLTSTILCIAITMTSCIVPVPAPTRTSAPPSLHDKIDLSFLQAGKTTRQEVEDNLGWSDSRIRAPRLFLGRWSTSSSATGWVIGGGYSAESGAFRNWSVKNLLIEFDSNDVVSAWRFVPDKELVAALSRHAMDSMPPGSFSQPQNLTVDHVYSGKTETVTITLSSDLLSYRVHGSSKHDFDIVPRKLECITLPALLKGEQERPEAIRFTLHFRETTRAGKKVTLEATPVDLMTMITYYAQTNNGIQPRGPVCH